MIGMPEKYSRRKRRRGEHRSRRRLAVFACLGIVLAAAVVLMFTPFFNIVEVYCQGNDKVAAEDVIAAADVTVGKNIFSIRMGKIRRNVESIPFVESASVRRVFPNKIEISIQECMPVSYVYTDEKCYMIDEEGKILRIIEDKESVDALVVSEEREKYDKLKQKNEEQQVQENDGEASATATPEPTATATVEPEEENTDESGETSDTAAGEQTTEPESTPTPVEGDILKEKYNIPVVLGLEYEKAEEGEMPKSRNEERYQDTLAMLKEMRNAELLYRATLVDVRNPSDIRIWIEDRLEIMLSSFDDMSYRMQFLARVIQEGISAYEHAVVDFRGDDVYVRPHDDGSAWVSEKKKSEDAEAEATAGKEEQAESESETTNEPDSGEDASPTDHEDTGVTSLENANENRQRTGQTNGEADNAEE